MIPPVVVSFLWAAVKALGYLGAALLLLALFAGWKLGSVTCECGRKLDCDCRWEVESLYAKEVETRSFTDREAQ